jgi:hypothetical protein
VLEIDMDKADGRRFEDADQRLVGTGRRLRPYRTRQRLMALAGKLLINAAGITS